MAHARVIATQPSGAVRLPEGWRIKSFDVLDSTSAALRRMVEAGTDAREGMVITTKTQTAGRGRSGRAWVSPVGNLYTSILVKSDDGLPRAPEIGFVAAVAVMAAIQSLMPDRASDAALRCKWPNDLLFDGAKVSGILLETAKVPDSEDVFVVLGIGLNLIPVTLPNPVYEVTSLAQQGGHVNTAQAMEALTKQLAVHLDLWRREGFGPIRRMWLERAAGRDDIITVQMPGEVLTGRFIDLDSDGALVLETRAEARRRVLAGDVVLSS